MVQIGVGFRYSLDVLLGSGLLDISVFLSHLESVRKESMETSFRSRIDRTFGFLNEANSDGDTHLWNVEERAAFKKNKGLSLGAGEGESDDEEASGYADFLKSENGMGREGQGERLNASFFGEEDLEELESGGEDDDGDEEDVEEQMRVGKKKKKGDGELTEIELGSRASGEGAGLSEPPKLEEDDGDDDEVREVREMVGMDDTLDFEDEEDEYDKVAVGREGTDDRLFMSQVRSFGASRQQLNPLPTSFSEMRQASRDRRANHKAALARLEEDDREAATRAAKELSQAREEFKLDTAEEPKMVADLPARQDNGGEAMDIDGDGHKEEPRDEARKSVAGNLESCRVSEGKQRKPGKRVRFSVDETAGAESNAGRSDQTTTPEPALTASTYPCQDDMPSTATTGSAVHSTVATSNRYSRVPDYVKNPSKYIHYTLDWSEEDEEKANVAAFHAARAVSSSAQDMVTDKQEGTLVESQGPSGSTKVSFNPLVSLSKRSSKESGRGASKDSSDMGIDASTGVLTNGVVNVAANFDMDSNLGGIITMDDDQDLSKSSQGKSGRVVRRYRNRVTDDIETD